MNNLSTLETMITRDSAALRFVEQLDKNELSSLSGEIFAKFYWYKRNPQWFKKGPFAIYGWNTLIFNQSRQLRRSRSRLECEVRTQPFQTHSWLELLSLKGLSDVLRFPLYGRVLHTAFWPE